MQYSIKHYQTLSNIIASIPAAGSVQKRMSNRFSIRSLSSLLIRVTKHPPQPKSKLRQTYGYICLIRATDTCSGKPGTYAIHISTFFNQLVKLWTATLVQILAALVTFAH